MIEINEDNRRGDDGETSSMANKNPSRVFASLLLDQINFPDVNALLESQSQIIHRLDQTNRGLARSNQLSTETFNSFALKDFQSYISQLGKMKADLEYIFKHIRIVKSKLQKKYPTQYEKAFKEYHVNVDDEMEDEDESLGEGGRGRVASDESAARVEETSTELTKDRSSSEESSKSAKSLLVNLIETARTRLSSMELVNGLVGTTTTTTITTTTAPAISTNSTTQQTRAPLEISSESNQVMMKEDKNETNEVIPGGEVKFEVDDKEVEAKSEAVEENVEVEEEESGDDGENEPSVDKNEETSQKNEEKSVEKISDKSNDEEEEEEDEGAGFHSVNLASISDEQSKQEQSEDQ